MDCLILSLDFTLLVLVVCYVASLFLVRVADILSVADYAMSGETVIVGDAGCTYLYRSNNDGRNINEILRQRTYAVALVFASDKDKPQGTFQICSCFPFCCLWKCLIIEIASKPL